MGRDIRYVMDLTGDTTVTILNEYEGYSIDEMNVLLEEEGLLSYTMDLRDLKKRRDKLLSELHNLEELILERDDGIV